MASFADDNAAISNNGNIADEAAGDGAAAAAAAVNALALGEENGDVQAEKKKKKKKKKKKRGGKKKSAGAGSGPGGAEGGAPHCRGLNEGVRCDSFTKYGQTWPPSKPVATLFSDGNFPEGEIMEHPLESNRKRITDAELRAQERVNSDMYNRVRCASECHRQVRKWAQSFIKPGIKLTDMCEMIENKNRELVAEAGLKAGLGFPTGCSLDHVAAHYTPNPGDETVLTKDHVMKIDFGTQIDGRIIDCAWTVHFNERYDPLVNAVREATETGLRAAGIDVRLCDVGEAIQEVMESYEIELDGKTHQVKCCRNLNGHSIAPYQIHAGKSVPIVKGARLPRWKRVSFTQSKHSGVRAGAT